MMESSVEKEDGSKYSKFANDKHAKRLLFALNSGRNDRHLCDGIVTIGQSRIYIQKAVLAAASSYFRSVFSYEMKDNSTKSEVDLTQMDITEETFHTVLDYIYTSEIELNEENIQDILQASDILLLGDLKEMCCEYLEGCISPQNCLGILEFSGRFTCPWVHLKVTLYIDEHIRDVVDTEEFMKLDAETLSRLLSRLTLNIDHDGILNAIMAWYEYSKEARDIEVGHVLQACYTGLNIRGFEMERLLPELRSKIEQMDLPQRGQRDVILVCGGEEMVTIDDHDCQNKVINTVSCVDPVECIDNFRNNLYKRWRKLAPMLTSRTGHKVVECGGSVYAFGGRNNDGEILNTGEKYDSLINRWIPVASMMEKRLHFGIVSMKDNIYVFGGCKYYMEPICSVEVYNIFTNTWRKLPDMNIKRQWFCCVALDRTIYVIGGGSQSKMFESIECFDTLTETWYSASPLREKRCNGKAVSFNGDIFLFGGVRRIECPSAMMHGGSIKHCGNEIYSSQSDTWVSMTQKNGHRGMLCANPEKSRVDEAVVIGDAIYAIGTFDLGTQLIHSVRGYDTRTHSWFCAVPSPPDYRAPLTSCAFKLPNFVFQADSDN